MFDHEVITMRVILEGCSRFLSFYQSRVPACVSVPAVIPLHSISVYRHLSHTEHPTITAAAHQFHRVAYSFSFISLGLYDNKLWAGAGID